MNADLIVDAVADAMAEAIGAIGTGDFPQYLLSFLNAVAGTDLCSAFERTPDGSLHYLFAAGEHPSIANFAETASIAYARRYWQRDRTTQRALARADGGVHLVRQAWNGIADPDYRRDCYERAGIVERLTLYSTRAHTVFASAYRTRESGHSSPAQVAALERLAPAICALVERHTALTRATSREDGPPLHELSRRLLESGRDLSAREAGVAAGLLLGRSQREIAEATGVAVSSVITYRRRAYRKLGVDNRRALGALVDGLNATGGKE